MKKITLLLAALLLATAPHAKIVRDPAQVRAFKHANPCPATGKVQRTCKGYVVDHVIPLACGGPDAPSNMQWQTVEDGKAKDKIERKNCQKVPHANH